MSNAEEKIEELEVESLDEETAEFLRILESFGLSDAVINAFLGKLRVFNLGFTSHLSVFQLISIR